MQAPVVPEASPCCWNLMRDDVKLSSKCLKPNYIAWE